MSITRDGLVVKTGSLAQLRYLMRTSVTAHWRLPGRSRAPGGGARPSHRRDGRLRPGGHTGMSAFVGALATIGIESTGSQPPTLEDLPLPAPLQPGRGLDRRDAAACGRPCRTDLAAETDGNSGPRSRVGDGGRARAGRYGCWGVCGARPRRVGDGRAGPGALRAGSPLLPAPCRPWCGGFSSPPSWLGGSGAVGAARVGTRPLAVRAQPDPAEGSWRPVSSCSGWAQPLSWLCWAWSVGGPRPGGVTPREVRMGPGRCRWRHEADALTGQAGRAAVSKAPRPC